MSKSDSVNISTITEYCVEYADAPNPVSRGLNGAQGFAELLSCPPGGNYTWCDRPAGDAPAVLSHSNRSNLTPPGGAGREHLPRFQAVDKETCYCAKVRSTMTAPVPRSCHSLTTHLGLFNTHHSQHRPAAKG